MSNIKILVAAHKKCDVPHGQDLFLPILVGSKGKESIDGFIRDDKGENISSKNPYYCELTGVFWAWKNLNSDYVGLCHYRRYFTCKKHLQKDEKGRLECVITKDEVKEKLEKADIILPKKRNYLIENLYSHYKHTMYVEPLDITGEIIKEKCPEYYPEFEKLKKRRTAHMFNMFIMKKEYLDEYCTWLFDILFELENRVDISKYDIFHARFFGRVSELLMDVWLYTKKYKYEEVKVMDLKPVNWLKKGTSFIMAKFTGKKYYKSF